MKQLQQTKRSHYFWETFNLIFRKSASIFNAGIKWWRFFGDRKVLAGFGYPRKLTLRIGNEKIERNTLFIQSHMMTLQQSTNQQVRRIS